MPVAACSAMLDLFCHFSGLKLHSVDTYHARAAPWPQQRQQQRGWRRRHPGLCLRTSPTAVLCEASSGSVNDIPVLSDEEGMQSGDEQQQAAGRIRGNSGGSLRRDEWRVPLPPHLHGKAPQRHWNANALAFLGDSVWELYARRRFFYPPTRKDSYFSLVIEHVRAETQERMYKQLLDSTFLTDTERDVLRWGRNATGVTPKRLSDTGLKRETYRAATAIECLSGYLYLSDPDRLHEMMSLLGLGDAPADGTGAPGSGTDGAQKTS